MTVSDPLALPATARLLAFEDGAERAIDGATLMALAADRAREVPRAAPRSIFGVSGENGVDTLLAILSVTAAGAIPAPMPLDTDRAVAFACFEHLRAAGYWLSDGGWYRSDRASSYSPGFELVMHSSGSTGRPKPLAIRFEAMRQNAADTATALGLTKDDVHIGSFSQCYMSGLYNAALLPLMTGASAVSAPRATVATIAALLDAIGRFRATVLWTSPLVASMLTRLRAVAPGSLASVRFAVSCTAPLSDAAKRAFEDKFDIPLLQSYGLCETLITTVENPAAPAPGSVGRPVGPPGAVRLAEAGEIVISNGAHFAGYLDRSATPAVVDPYRTGDIGRFDADGNLHVVGRLSEVINRDGIKVAPETIETAINGLPGVELSCVVDLAGGDAQGRIVAFVKADRVSAQQVRATLADRLPRSHMPQEIRFLDEFPLTSSGKIDRSRLRKGS